MWPLPLIPAVSCHTANIRHNPDELLSVLTIRKIPNENVGKTKKGATTVWFWRRKTPQIDSTGLMAEEGRPKNSGRARRDSRHLNSSHSFETKNKLLNIPGEPHGDDIHIRYIPGGISLVDTDNAPPTEVMRFDFWPTVAFQNA